MKECGANNLQRKRQSDTEAGKVLKSEEQPVSGHISARLQWYALLVHLQQAGSKQAANWQQVCWSLLVTLTELQPKVTGGVLESRRPPPCRQQQRGAEAPVWQQQGQG